MLKENEDHEFELEKDAGDNSWNDITSKNFIFATPSFVSNPEKVIDFGENSDHVFSRRNVPETTFTFAAPATISQPTNFQEQSKQNPQSEDNDKPHRPRIARKIYQPPKNLFTSTLHESEGRDKLLQDYEQLKKHSKSRSSHKIDVNNSITCTNVPKQLLPKTVAKQYFLMFGPILKIVSRPRKAIITIYYANKDAANVAYYKSGYFMGEKFDVHWTSSETEAKSPIKKKESSRDAVRNFITADDDDINAELEAMMGLEYNLYGSGSTAQGQVSSTEAKQRSKKPKAPVSKEATKYEKPPPKVTKSEKMESDTQIPAIIPKATAEELLSIIRQPATTSEDKYKILEARDRFLRLKQVKPYTLAAAKITKGTCPDMCPEKERLMRESQRQVAVFEQMEGKEYRINHAIAVKQYSRSSADQEEPLAHELRPVESLKMTMSYLVHEIMNMCMVEGTNLGDWFHFLWDRTRGIRKDITQQELCCMDSVELVEQCARFHIFCSERLCAEEPSVFDKKINSENLTKCLQTLKYMYHDLRVKGMVCKNEAEFRGYIILLNLHDGNFMWDLQKLPPDIQKSPEVRFAIEVYSSIESHNFSKFFKLVRKTTYLNSCILLRYFNQVRVKALSVMVKAYCRIPSTQFPLYELIDILGFEDENEAVYFCEQVGLSISNDEMHIVFNREGFNQPISMVEQGRAIHIVESKRILQGLTVGQCIAGGETLEKTYKTHVPHDSFNANGYLTLDAMNVQDQEVNTKNRSVSDETDPYEFMEKDSSKPLPRLKPQSEIRDQTDSVAKKPSQTFITGPKIESSGSGDVPSDVSNKNSKSSMPLFPAFSKEQFTSIKPSSVFHKQNSNKVFGGTDRTAQPFGTKLPTVDVKSNNDAEPDKKLKSTFAAQNENPGIVWTTNTNVNKISTSENTTVFQQRIEPSKLQNASPFAMALNKSIFSGNTYQNMFSKPIEGATIFGNKSVPVQNAETDTKRDKDREEQEKIEAESKKQKLEELRKQLQVEKLKLQELERQKRSKMVEEKSRQIVDELESEVVKEICASIIKEEIDHMEITNSLSESLADSLVNQIVQEVCQELVKEEMHIQTQMNEVFERIKQRLVRKYYKRWRQNATKRRRQRNALNDTPVWLQSRTVSECAKLLYHPQQDLVIRNMCRRRTRSESEPLDDNLAPVEIIIYAGIKENIKSSDNEIMPKIFWKLVISWPDLENKVLLWQHKKVMNTYLNPEDYTQEPMMKIYQPNPYETLSICIRHFEGIINERNLVGTDGLLLIASTSEDLNAVKQRLSRTILSRSKLMPIPIAIVFLGEDHLVPENVELELDLEILLESGYVSEYTVAFEKGMGRNQILRLTQSAILWLTTNKSPPVPLEMDYLNQVLGTCLTQELWLRIHGHSNFNKHLADGLDDPVLIINLHNEAVTHLMDIFLDQESLQYTDFPGEFKVFLNDKVNLPCTHEYFDDAWKQEKNRSLLEQVLSSFLLPEWKHEWPTGNLCELDIAINSYCLEALPTLDSSAVTSQITSALFLMSDDSRKPNFIDLLLEIMKIKIQLLDEKLRVVYNKNHVKHFRTLPWWFKSNVLLEYITQKESVLEDEEKGEILTGEPLRKRPRLPGDGDEDVDTYSFYNPNDSLAEFCKDTQDQVLTVHDMCKKLEFGIDIQKTKMTALNETLKRAIVDEEMNLSKFNQ